MTEKTMMITGALIAIFGMGLSFIVNEAFGIVLMSVMGGALFGKGHGIWEAKH